MEDDVFLDRCRPDLGRPLVLGPEVDLLASFRRKSAGGVGIVGSALNKDVVLGFLSRQDEDYRMHVSIDLAGSVGFRKAPPANSIGRFMPGDCWIGWYSGGRTHVFI